jgi:hypothetical protein
MTWSHQRMHSSQMNTPTAAGTRRRDQSSPDSGVKASCSHVSRPRLHRWPPLKPGPLAARLRAALLLSAPAAAGSSRPGRARFALAHRFGTCTYSTLAPPSWSHHSYRRFGRPSGKAERGNALRDRPEQHRDQQQRSDANSSSQPNTLVCALYHFQPSRGPLDQVAAACPMRGCRAIQAC